MTSDNAAVESECFEPLAATPKYDRDNPLDADLVVVDESSMLAGAHLLLVGDADQLPSVGAREVLRDLLADGAIRASRW